MDNKLLYPELSYKLVGILFEVHTELGNRYQEKYYQRAMQVKLKKNNIPFKKEISVNLTVDGERIGKYFLDFLIDNKIVLELKAKPNFTKNDFKQVKAYLHAFKLELGLLVNFYGDSLEYKRILNLID